ncbi:MAG: hypothetical protein L0312_31205, partial [Acidobacteria bacterium]|nr:hypothetical protein [Acidobacteriota bacterium]
MANRYNFTSPGSVATDAITDFLVREEMKQRQAMIDEINRRNIESQMQERKAQAERQSAAEQRQAKAEEFERAKDIVDIAGAGERVDPDTKALLTRAGFGGRMQDVTLPATEGYGVLLPEEAPDAQPQEDVTILRPGARYEQGRQVAIEKQALEREKARDRIEAEQIRSQEREEAAQRHREFMAGQNAATRAIAQQGVDVRASAEERA